MRLDPIIGRRALLRAGGMSAALLAASRLRPLPAALAAEPPGTLQVLSPSEARIMSAIGARITDSGDPAMPRFADTDALATIDRALRQLPADVTQQISWALWLFEYGPPVLVGKLSTFTGFDSEWQDTYLADWEQSRLAVRRIAFQAFKNLSFLGYYSQDATWPGIQYRGPWLKLPRVQVGSNGWIERGKA